MQIDNEKAAEWLARLLDGVRNHNHAAEVEVAKLVSGQKLKDNELSALLVVLMEADPWPYSANRDLIENLLDQESRKRGFSDWVEALHLMSTNDLGLAI